MPNVTPEWMSFVSANFVTPATGITYANTAVTLPAQMWPLTGLTSLTYNDSTKLGTAILDEQIHTLIADNTQGGSPSDPIVVFGYSQSAQISSIEKGHLRNQASLGAQFPPMTFVLMANPLRPNGGFFSRLGGLGMTPWTPVMSAPTDTGFQTYDIARQYDFFADFPAHPLNLVAAVNAVFGLMNHDYSSVTLDRSSPNYDPNTLVQQYGDTTYYLIPSKHLPMLEPLRAVGLVALADAVEPTLRALVELGYERSTPLGQPTNASLAPKSAGPSLLRDLQSATTSPDRDRPDGELAVEDGYKQLLPTSRRSARIATGRATFAPGWHPVDFDRCQHVNYRR